MLLIVIKIPHIYAVFLYVQIRYTYPMKKQSDALMEVFKTQYERLNTEQRKAVDTIEGPVVVIAGPGTGKTQILALRIANILLKTDTPASAILAIAYSDAAVVSMRKRLASIIGERAYQIAITTFHGFANSLIDQYRDEFPQFTDSTPAESVERIAIVEEILLSLHSDNEQDALVIATLRPQVAPLTHAQKILHTISELKREYITPNKFAELVEKQKKDFGCIEGKVHEKGPHKGKMKGVYQKIAEKIERNTAFVTVYERYEEKMKQQKLYDFDDMLIVANDVLSTRQSLKQLIQEKYLYVLVDEHQDTNMAQNELVSHIIDFHDQPNIFVVGDEKQAIYRFQGADIGNFLRIKERYSQATLISLVKNYRSKQHILDTAHNVLGETGRHVDIPRPQLESHNENTDIAPVELFELHDQYHEAQWLVQEIKKNNNKKSSIAVIVRDNIRVGFFTEQLRRAGVEVFSLREQMLFDLPQGRQVQYLLESIAYPEHDEILGEALLSGLYPIDLQKALEIFKTAKKERVTIVHALSMHDAHCARIYNTLVQNARELPVIAMLDKIYSTSRIMEYVGVKSVESEQFFDEYVGVLKAFTRIAEQLLARKRDATLIDLVERLRVMRNHEIRVPIQQHNIDHDAGGVFVLTAHKSKGLEFDTVYIPSLVNGIWSKKNRGSIFYIPEIGIGEPLLNSAESQDVTDDDDNALDDLRLLYVALTRGRDQVKISYYTHNEKELELHPALMRFSGVQKIVVPYEQQTLYEHTIQSITLEVREKKSVLEQIVERALVERGLSVTALNNYIDCPWKYIFKNALQLPYIQPAHLAFGSAMHAALEYWLRPMTISARATGEVAVAGVDKVFDVFVSILQKQAITKEDEKHYVELGKSALLSYEPYMKQASNYVLELEYGVKDLVYEHNEPFQGSVQQYVIPITGKIDRVEHNNNELFVVDYKTGNHHSKNSVLGLTKNSDGAMLRQLRFYKFLLSKDPLHKNIPVTLGRIQFIQPNDRGGLSSVDVPLVNEDIAIVEHELKNVISAILRAEYKKHTCKDVCEFCTLGKIIIEREKRQ